MEVKMTKEHANFIKNALEYVGEEVEVREYSGRGMMGRTTFGVVFDHYCLLIPAILDFIKENEIPYKDIPNLKSLRQDNMGRGLVIY